MWLEILLASVLGFVIYWFVSKDKEETLPLEDGWWGPGVRPTAGEDKTLADGARLAWLLLRVL
uniref:Epoxide hydrolase n=1 Tax=Cyprinus carpio TaxID=7962 RepID=A0A8C2FE94_CYPCA